MKIFPRSRALALPLLASAPFLFPSPPLGAESVPASKPNVVFVLVDDMGWGDLNINWEKHGAAFGNREGRASYKTPQLDRLAEDGMLLLRHYTAAPVSVAARACLITGMHTGHTRQVRDNTFDTPIADVHTLGSVMRSAGYATAVIGKWGVGGGGESDDATLRGRDPEKNSTTEKGSETRRGRGRLSRDNLTNARILGPIRTSAVRARLTTRPDGFSHSNPCFHSYPFFRKCKGNRDCT